MPELLLEQVERHPGSGEVDGGGVAVGVDRVVGPSDAFPGALVFAVDGPARRLEDRLVIVPVVALGVLLYGVGRLRPLRSLLMTRLDRILCHYIR